MEQRKVGSKVACTSLEQVVSISRVRECPSEEDCNAVGVYVCRVILILSRYIILKSMNDSQRGIDTQRDNDSR